MREEMNNSIENSRNEREFVVNDCSGVNGSLSKGLYQK